MARPASSDPLDRFRFRVTFVTSNAQSGALTILKTIKGEGDDLKDSISAGFSEVEIPTSNITEITYRENIQPNRLMKKPGLTRYDPIVLKKGATLSRELYDWYKLVSNDAIGYSIAGTLVNALSIPPVYPALFRKDLIITALDRAGNAAKSWVVLDAFPIGYKGGNNFDASSSEKLIAELTITFESFVEISGDDLQALQDEANDAAKSASIAAALGFGLAGGN